MKNSLFINSNSNEKKKKKLKSTFKMTIIIELYYCKFIMCTI